MKKVFRMAALAMAAVCTLALAGCGGGGDSAKTTLRIYNWGDYIDPDVLEQFKQDNPDINVVYDMFDSNEAMLAKLDGGAQYDIYIPSDYMIEKLIKDDRLAKIDVSKIENYKNIDDRFKNLAFDPNNEYSVPYTWGTLGILYNKTKVTEPVTSWDILWDEKYKGDIIMYDSARDSMAAALKKLGYSCNEKDTDKINQAAQLLKDQKPLVKAYQTDAMKQEMINGNAALALVYSGDAILCMNENPDLGYAVPEQGSNKFFDSIVVDKNCQNMDAAYRFINYLCDAEVAAKNCEYIGYATPNKAALDLMGEGYVDNVVYNPSDAILDKCEVFLDLGDLNTTYNKIWEEVKMQ